MDTQPKTRAQRLCAIMDPTRTMSHRIACSALACFAVTVGAAFISTVLGIYSQTSSVIMFAGLLGMLICMVLPFMGTKSPTRHDASTR